MLDEERIGCFVATTEPARAKAFYEGTLGLRFVEDGPFALVFDAGGTMLRVQKVAAFEPAQFTVLGWTVHDIAMVAGHLAERGVEFMRIPGIPQDERGIWITPNGDRVAWFKDPDGNTLSLSQFAPTAP